MTLFSMLKTFFFYAMIELNYVEYHHEKGVSFVDYRLRGHNFIGFDQLRAAYI